MRLGLRCCVGCRREHVEGLSWKHEGCAVANSAPVVANTEAPRVANRHGKYRDLAKRREYMRQYMARRRAEARAA